MPHVIVKLWPGKSEQQKTHLAETIAKDVAKRKPGRAQPQEMSILYYGEESVSVAIEEVRSQDWAQEVYNLTFNRSGTSFTRSPATPCKNTELRKRRR